MKYRGRKYLGNVRAIVWLLRMVVGALFVFAGLVKGIDLWGFVFKIEEYLGVWGISEPRSIVFLVAMTLAGAEFLLGLLLVAGLYRKPTVVLMSVFELFMLPLTLYIYIFDPVSDCGCFGDALIISNAATFWKNVAICAALVYLWRFNDKTPSLYSDYSRWLVVLSAVVYFMVVAVYGYNVQPMVDFRSFPMGTDIAMGDDISDADDGGDAAQLSFIYERDGIKRTFDVDSLPDSTWTFVGRVGDVDMEPQSEALVLMDDSGDLLDDVVPESGDCLMLVMTEPTRTEISFSFILNEIGRQLEENGGALIAVTAGGRSAAERWRDLSMAAYPVYLGVDTQLKELVRGTMALVYLKDGRIVWKRSLSTVDDRDLIEAVDSHTLEDYAPVGNMFFKVLTVGEIVFLMLLRLLDSTGRLVAWRIRRRRWMRRLKMLNNSTHHLTDSDYKDEKTD